MRVLARVRPAWALVAVTVAFLVADTVINAQVQPLLSNNSTVVHGWPLIPAAALGSAVMGALILHRLPRHPIGWLLVAIGTATSLSVLCEIYSIWYVEAGGPGTRLAAEVTGWLALALGGALAFALLSYLFLLAPDGHLLSPRWRYVCWLAVAGEALYIAGLAASDPKNFTGRGDPRNTGVVASTLLTVAVLVLTAALALSIVALVRRLRRTTGETRQQVRLFAVGAAVVGVGVLLLLVVQAVNGGKQTWTSAVPLQVSICLLPVFLAIAVLRYRLYDVDVIINRAVVLSVAVGFVVVGYTVLVVGLGRLLGGQTHGFWPSVVATAAVAMAFQPLRGRVVRFADRLAYGARAVPYDALSALIRQLGDSPDPTTLLPAVAEAAGSAVSATRAEVTLDVDHGEPQTATWTRGERKRPAGDTTVTVEVADAAGHLGWITVTPARGRAVRPHERALLDDLAEQPALAFRNARLQAELAAHVAVLDQRTAELAASRRRLFEAGDAERRRIERAINRDVMPDLGTLTRTLDAATAPDAAVPDPAAIDELVAGATRALEALRELTRGIFPTMLARAGLGPALSAYLGRVQPDAVLEVDPSAEGVRFAARTEAAAYAGVVAAVGTGPVSRVQVRVADGCVFVACVGATGLGGDRQTVLDRVEALDGSLAESADGLVVRLPVAHSTPAPVPHPGSAPAPVAADLR
jgi:hypothetical protein